MYFGGMDVEQLKVDVRVGRVGIDHLLKVIESLVQRVAELEKQLAGQAEKKLLDPATFAGLVISDHAAVYGKFSRSQKCWAHLLRKAIKLTLFAPDNADYRRLAAGCWRFIAQRVASSATAV